MTPLWVARVSLDNGLQNRTVSQKITKTKGPDEDVVMLLNLAQELRAYFVPFVISTGLAFNAVCSFGFHRTKLCKKFFTPLFFTISLSNTGFLVTLLLIWLKEEKVDIYAAPGICPMVIFLSHLFPFLSFWTSIMAAVLLTLQPIFYTVNKFARGSGRGKILSICLSVLSFTVYLYKTWTNGVLTYNSVRYCTVLPDTQSAMKVLNILDVFFLLFLPFVGFLMFDVIIAARYISCCGRGTMADRRRYMVSRDALCVIISHSVCFIIFVGPGCLSKLYFYLKDSNIHYNLRDLLLQNLFQYSFYTYFALTPIVHVFISKSFRTHMRNTLCGVKGRTNRHLINFVQNDMTSEQTLL